MPAPPTIPQFTMGQNILPSFLQGTQGITNALGQWQARNQQADRLAQQQQQFEATNKLAQARLGMDGQRLNMQQQAFAAEQQQNQLMNPLRVRQLQAQIGHMESQGANEAQMAPLRRQLLEANLAHTRAQTENIGAKEKQKQEILRSMGMLGGGPQQPQNAMPQGGGVIPQSAPDGVMPGGVTPMAFDGNDPNLINVQQGLAEPEPHRPATVPQLIQGMTPAQRAQMSLAAVGMSEVGKVIGEVGKEDQLGKTAQGEVQKDLVGLTGTIGRLESISKRFDSKFLKIPERAGFAWSALQDKFGTLPEDQKADLSRYTKFRQTSINNAALYVKYLSGVAVSEQEFQRIMKTLPNAGAGIFDGDSPTEFLAKMNEAVVQSKMAFARAKYLNDPSRGFKGKPWEAGIALDDMRGIIDQRGAQIEDQLRQASPNIQPQQLQGVVRKRLKQEFGI